ncbi:MAG: polyphosphate polymerase domain-containing protein [Oscillospiraceae bacterium]|nr:polyphosphate polymerase domain-containing protein [Oscillospiraceae bacterium]
MQKIFERKEEKYLLDAQSFDDLWEELGSRLIPDDYGSTKVMNIYYDNSGFELLDKSVRKPAYKEKLRIRSYGVPDDDSEVFAEIKRKYNGTVYKRRTSGTYKQIADLLENGELMDHDIQIQKEILWMMERYGLHPVAFIGYERTGYTSPTDEGLRITVDSDIRYRLDELDLRKGDRGTLLREPGFRIMEVKSSSNLPLWFADILTRKRLFSGSFSKIGTCFTEVIFPQTIEKQSRERSAINA